jgi:hypothetical protein
LYLVLIDAQRGDEFLQGAAGIFVVGGEKHFIISSSFRGAPTGPAY